MKPPCSCCYYYKWKELDKDAELIAQKLKHIKFDGVFGPPRGGLPLAVKLSHLLNIPLFLDGPKSKKTLVVDDIADTGGTLFAYACNGYITATLYFHQQSSCVPTVWLHEKTDKYIVYPWEKQKCHNK